MAHIIFLLLSADIGHSLELSHPRGEEAEVLPTYFHISLVEYKFLVFQPAHSPVNSAARGDPQAELQALAIGSFQHAPEPPLEANPRVCEQSTNGTCSSALQKSDEHIYVLPQCPNLSPQTEQPTPLPIKWVHLSPPLLSCLL